VSENMSFSDAPVTTDCAPKKKRLEPRKDSTRVARDGRSGAVGQEIAQRAAADEVDPDLAELAGSVDRDLTTPDLRPQPGAPKTTIGPTSWRSAMATNSPRCRPPRRPSRFI
jgi:hypothetical protein